MSSTFDFKIGLISVRALETKRWCRYELCRLTCWDLHVWYVLNHPVNPKPKVVQFLVVDSRFVLCIL